MILTGCRVGEAAGLCWDAVRLDSERPFVQIIRSRNWYAKPGEKKLGKGLRRKALEEQLTCLRYSSTSYKK